MKLFKYVKDISTDLDNMHKKPLKVLRIFEIFLNILIVLLAISIMLTGEIAGLIIILPMNRMVKVVISRKQMNYTERVLKGTYTVLFYFFIEVIIVKVLAYFFPYLNNFI